MVGRRTGHATAIAIACGAAGLGAYQDGRFQRALALVELAATMFRERCIGDWTELSMTRLWAIWCLVKLGRLAEARRRLPVLVREARQRSDRLFATNLVTGLNVIVSLAAGEPERARQDAETAIREWSHEGCHLQHYWGVVALSEIDLYEGDAERAHARLNDLWPRLSNSLLLRIRAVSVEAHEYHARYAIACARNGGPRRAELLRAARRDARIMRKVSSRNALPQSLLILAQVAEVEGARDHARDLLAQAYRLFAEARMSLYAAVCAHHLGRLGEYETYSTAQSIVEPKRLTSFLAPGLDVAHRTCS